MDRRKAIKGLGLTLGYAVATPSVISILQSCNNNSQVSWKPQFFTKNDSLLLENLIDYILPKTDKLPGANDLNIAQFIDAYFNEVVYKDEQNKFKNGISIIAELVKNENYESVLKKYLKATKKDKKAFLNNDKDTSVLETLTKLRSITIWAYKTSQKVGEDILAYDPIPGNFFGCISLDKATKGKAWSL